VHAVRVIDARFYWLILCGFPSLKKSKYNKMTILIITIIRKVALACFWQMEGLSPA